ncbi:MAG: helix-hairpin-helix domain-containing protein [Cyclobacteriaceae bacterium]|nr:helix-hairpin-helix domain-containing protein [Cyclobacteriaceae bacterium]
MKPRLIILLFIVGSNGYAQEFPKREIDLQQFVDELFANQDDDLNYEDLYENLAQLLSNPADLNRVTKEQLQALFFLNDPVIESILNYRLQAGPFLSVYELQNVPGMTRDLFLKIVPFVTVNDPGAWQNSSLWNRIQSGQNSYLILRYDQTLEKKLGYQETAPPGSKYIGSPGRYYARFRSSYPGDYSFGITAEKDAGEAITWAPTRRQYGPDYLSFHAQVLNKGRLKNLIVGDYQAQFGQGLLLGSAFGIGKSAEAVTTIRRPTIGFMSYTSLYESGYFRGVSVTYSLHKQLHIHGMYSSRWRDGNLVRDTLDDNATISSLSTSGLHRTATELANKNTLFEQNVVGGLTFKVKTLELGVLLHHTWFNRAIIRKPTVYNQFYFRGSQNTNVGAYWNYTLRQVAVFGEVAQTLGKGFAATTGLIASITSSLDFSFLVRTLDRDYTSFYSNALAENSIAQNELGFYWGWKYQLSKKFSFTGYVDLFRFPWLRYRSYSPSNGTEWLMRFNYKPSRTILFFIQFMEETKQRNLSAESNLYTAAPGIKRNYWLHLEYEASPQLQFRTRAQFNTYQLGETTTGGMVLLQDITFHIQKFSVSGRYALFDTDSYDNRIYIYERDVWLAFTFPAYEGVGVKNYLLVQYSFNRQVDLWLRWAFKRYTDRDTIGSAGETIDGNRQNDVRFQVRIRF